MITEEQYTARLARLKNEITDLSLPADLHGKVLRVLGQTLRHFEDIDPYILGIEDTRLEELLQLLNENDGTASDRVMLRLSHLDIFDLERVLLCAEGYHRELGGAQDLKMDADELSALTRKIAEYRRTAFPERMEDDGG